MAQSLPTPKRAPDKIKGMNPLLSWVSDLLSYFQVETIYIPGQYRDKVLAVKKELQDDVSGLVNTILDFAIECALVDYKIESNNTNLTETLNNWLGNVNSDLRGRVPVGIRALAKEYFRERWKGSSFLLLRSFWETKDDLVVPTTLFFIDGEDIVCYNPNVDGVIRLGTEKYQLMLSSDKTKNQNLPSNQNELIFIQKPFESWGSLTTNPFIIKRGLYHNMKFLRLLHSKGEFILGRAIEYMLAMLKGSERLALENRSEYIYNEEDLRKAKDDLENMIKEKKTSPGLPLYATNFDTKFEHIIPDYQKIINDNLYSPIERKILAGLGLVDITEGIASTRRESILNPKPFVGMIEEGIADFSTLLLDLVEVMKEKNLASHPKWMNAKIRVKSSPIKQFVDDKLRTMLRSVYDRGCLSKRTFTELVGGVDYDVEVMRRKEEKRTKEDEVLYPPVIQNIEDKANEKDGEAQLPVSKENVPEDKKGIEKKNFKKA